MPPPDLDTLLKRSAILPTLPQVVGHILATLNDDSAGADALVHRLNTDPSIVARLLSAANSAAFGLNNQIDSTRQAIMVLGLERVRSITLATAIIGNFSQRGAAFDPRLLWRHSIGVATCARVLAERLGHNAELAFTAGLLHDIGQILMYAVSPDGYAEVLQRRQTLDENIVVAERAVFGYDHAEAGGELASRWQLPSGIVAGIRGHHDPANGEYGEIGDLVHVAEVLSHALDLGEMPNNRVPELSDLACASLGIEWRSETARFAEIGARYEGMRLALGL